jgi:nucleoside-diphosphate-sugar epimerase
MKVLVTGGTGVVGNAALAALIRAGHEVRLFSRHAAEAVQAWPGGVEARPGDIADPASVQGAAAGCQAILHIAGIVAESGPHATFQRVNIDGTANILAEATRSRVRRFVYVSSLGADRGTSDYHRSKFAAEELVRAWPGAWVVLRPGNVYGPGDEVISLLLRMVRSLPAVPVVGRGDQPFQPIWHEDLGAAIGQALEREDVAHRTLELAGTETTTIDELLDALARITQRDPARLPLPALLARLGAKVASAVGVSTPVDEGQITMLEEGSLIEDPAANALTHVFQIDPTPLERGLVMLADELPEKTPDEGVGALHHKAFWVDIEGSRYTAEELCRLFAARFGDVLPLEGAPEPGSEEQLTEGATVTLKLPLRGNIQVRVTETSARSILLATVQGHPLAGAVRFRFDEQAGLLRFMIDIWDRAATVADWIGLRIGGAALQNNAWRQVLEGVVELSGGQPGAGPGHASTTLDEVEARETEEWLKGILARLERREREEELTRE